MQRLENMAKIVKFVYVMIILLSLFLVATNSKRNIPCVYDGDCPIKLCRYPLKAKCLGGICHCR
ncbi:unnamed protein product [Trifolium pratense]|uniref:Uncharacterized protein n=1 Tax=Trifolium pratense TaxID=57577 RepID=A0ACB0LJQ3_TRIPR|nr:unnamed protein product [Trifolium pratense]